MPDTFHIQKGGKHYQVNAASREEAIEKVMAFAATSAEPAEKSLRPANKSLLGAGPVAEAAIGATDAALTVGRGIFGKAAQGLTTLGSLVRGVPLPAAVNMGEDVSGVISGGPHTESGAKQLEGVARGGEFVSGVANNAIANTVDFVGGRGATDLSNTIRDEGLSRGLGEAGATVHPILGAIGETLPEAVGMIVGTKGVGRAAKTVDTPSARDIPAPQRPSLLDSTQPQVSVGRPGLDAPVDMTPVGDVVPFQTVVEGIKKGKAQDVADAVIPDREIVESAQRMGLDLNPEHYSTNKGFQDVARALKAQPGTRLEVNERRLLDELSQRGNRLVVEMEGSLDNAAVSETIRGEFQATIAKMADESDGYYKRVNDAVPNATVVDITRRGDTPGIAEFIDGRLGDLGGNVSQLTTPEKALYDLLKWATGSKGKPGKPVTYLALDRIRKDIGEGFRGRGQFADASQQNLTEVYDVISDFQRGVVHNFGVGDLYDSGRRLVAERKLIEDQAVSLFGRHLSDSLAPKLSSAATALSKGDITKLEKIMNALPEARRGEVAATILSDMFRGGSRTQTGVGQGFVKTWESLNAKPTAKNALFRHLPDEARQRFDDIGRVLTGIVRSNQKPMANPSGSSGPIIKALEDLSAVEKVYQVSKKVAAAEGVGSAVGVPGIGTAAVVGGLLAKQKTPMVVAADNMISSPAFARMVRESEAGNVDVANKVIQNSPQFKKWVTTVSPADAQAIATIGFVQWLSGENE